MLDRSGLGHSLRPLQRDGLITLDRSGADRRSVVVTLTDQGRQRYVRATTLWRSAQDRVDAALGTTVAGELREQLNEIAADDRLA